MRNTFVRAKTSNLQKFCFLSEFPKQIMKFPNKNIINFKEVQETIKSTLNRINGIAFGSHDKRFKGNGRFKSPGPGDYDIDKPHFIRKQIEGNNRHKNIIERKVEQESGPGEYYNGKSSMIKHSYNVNVPQNAIEKQKENVRDVHYKNWSGYL